ncbi:MAG: SPASM domain-containing protein [Deltaproteobacteria bacterium]|nr:SPASM domain-containing protein [Deltaproteobacteria bacterium]
MVSNLITPAMAAQSISPTHIRIDASTRCQLRCPICVASGAETFLGRGTLSFDHFKMLLDKNPQIRQVELASKGEAFLNRQLSDILRYAHEKNVATSIDHGVNLNDASTETLEALVKYQTTGVRVAIDGATQETYQKYRIGGDLRRVMDNIIKINRFKDKYASPLPALVFQFIVFGHNEHEMRQAVTLARMLKMDIYFQMNHTPDAFPVRDRDLVRQWLGYADRKEYAVKKKRDYSRHVCFQMWRSPQINWDGKLLGCSRNWQHAFAENVFEDDLITCINNDGMRYTRDVLMGKKAPREDTPCRQCPPYLWLAEHGDWISESEIEL